MKTLPHGTQDNILEKILLIPSCQNSAKVWPLMNLHNHGHRNLHPFKNKFVNSQVMFVTATSSSFET